MSEIHGDMILPGAVIASLYRQVLVIPGLEQTETVPLDKPVKTAPATGTKPADPTPSAYRFLGNNSKKVVVVVDFPNDAFLPEHHLQFLGKILGACRMNLGDIAIVNHAAQPVVIHILKQQLQPAHILLFGPAPTDIQLPLSFPPFKQQQYDSCQYLYATPLDQLNRDGDEGKQLKGQLWACLKQMFNV